MSQPLNEQSDIEKGRSVQLETSVPPNRHSVDDSQPGIPLQHRQYGSPVPLGLTSFGCGFFLVSAFSLYTEGIHTPNVFVPVLILYAGISQTLCGWWEMFLGNTFGATLFASYGAFNLTFGAMYLPAFGVISAYTNTDGTLRPEFLKAIGMFNVVWMMVTILFIIGSLRSSLAILSTLVFTGLALLANSIFYLTGHDGGRIAAAAFGMCATATAWWTAMAGFWQKETTYRWIKLDPLDLSSKKV